jgi:uncharacterized alkaline shock family protein YloU
MTEHELRGPGGSITISSGVLTQVVVLAAESADGARVPRPRRGLDVELEEGRVRVGLELAARYGAVLPELARDVQGRVEAALRGMCGLTVESVDVTIAELDA